MTDLADGPIGQAVAGLNLDTPAAAVEGFGRGLSANTTDIAGGGGPEVAARAEQSPMAAGIGEFAGDMLRNVLSTTIAGPAALYANAAVNVVGHGVDQMYRHDPKLTREAVVQNGLIEAISATAGYTLPMGMNIAGRLVKSAGRSIAEKIGAKAGIQGLVDQALESGLFAKTAKSVEEKSLQEIAGLRQTRQVFHDTLDSVVGAQGERSPVGFFGQASKMLLEHANKLDGPERELLVKVASDVSRPNFRPSRLVQAEQMIQAASKRAAAAEDGYTAHVLSQAAQELQGGTDGLMVLSGQNPAAYRELARNEDAWLALRAQAKAVGGGEAVQAVGKFAAREAAAAAGGAVLGPMGSKVAMASVAGMTGAATAKTVAQSGPALAAQALYSSGRAVTDLESSAFAQWLGQRMGANATATAERLASTGGAAASKASLDALVQLCTAHGSSPDSVNAFLARFSDTSYLPNAHRDVALSDLDNTMASLRAQLPARVRAPSLTDPPSSRQLTPAERRRIGNYVQGLVAPQDVMNAPTLEGMQAVRDHYPASLAAFSADLLQKLGPNTPLGHPLRSLAAKHGLTSQPRDLSLFMQAVHDHATQPPDAPQGRKNSRQGVAPERDRGGAAQTAQSSAQERRQAGE